MNLLLLSKKINKHNPNILSNFLYTEKNIFINSCIVEKHNHIISKSFVLISQDYWKISLAVNENTQDLCL